VYEVYVRSFADSDGDGIADIGDLRRRLPYLADLGVDGARPPTTSSRSTGVRYSAAS
jgi:glycosidase